MFNVVQQTERSLTLSLVANDETLKIYPYNFEYLVTYKLLKNGLRTTIKVRNKSPKTLLFNIGEHPGFKLFSNVSNYKVLFQKSETFTSPSVNENKLLDFNNLTSHYKNLKSLDITDELFENDAIINNCVKSKFVYIKSKDYNLKYSFRPFKTFALWKKVGAQFLCLEPWNGYADTIQTTQDLKDKPQLICLKPNRSKTLKTEFIIKKEYKS